MLLRVLLLLLLVVTSSGRALTTVHVIPHSHEDPGWIFTSDQYYEQKSKYRLSTTYRTTVHQHCARGHCMGAPTPLSFLESAALCRLLFRLS